MTSSNEMRDIDIFETRQAKAIQKKCSNIGINSLRHLHEHYTGLVDDVDLTTLNDCLWLMCIKKEIATIKEKYGTGNPKKIEEIKKNEINS